MIGGNISGNFGQIILPIFFMIACAICVCASCGSLDSTMFNPDTSSGGFFSFIRLDNSSGGIFKNITSSGNSSGSIFSSGNSSGSIFSNMGNIGNPFSSIKFP